MSTYCLSETEAQCKIRKKKLLVSPAYTFFLSVYTLSPFFCSNLCPGLFNNFATAAAEHVQNIDLLDRNIFEAEWRETSFYQPAVVVSFSLRRCVSNICCNMLRMFVAVDTENYYCVQNRGSVFHSQFLSKKRSIQFIFIHSLTVVRIFNNNNFFYVLTNSWKYSFILLTATDVYSIIVCCALGSNAKTEE